MPLTNSLGGRGLYCPLIYELKKNELSLDMHEVDLQGDNNLISKYQYLCAV